MLYRVYYNSPKLLKKLKEKYSDIPLKEILTQVKEKISSTPYEGKQSPFPFSEGTLTYSCIIRTLTQLFRVTVIYAIDEKDLFVDIFDIGIVPIAESDNP